MTRTSSYAGAIAGDVLYTQVDSDEATLTAVGIADPIGSVVTTLTLSDVGGARIALPGNGSDLAVYDEYGNRAGARVKAGALDYGWLGGKERASDPSGLVLMGVRLFNSATGLFSSVDPVVGGNESVYGYPNDPVNKLDLDGRRGGKSNQKEQYTRGELQAASNFERGLPYDDASLTSYRRKAAKNEKVSGERNKQKRAQRGESAKKGGGKSSMVVSQRKPAIKNRTRVRVSRPSLPASRPTYPRFGGFRLPAMPPLAGAGFAWQML